MEMSLAYTRRRSLELELYVISIKIPKGKLSDRTRINVGVKTGTVMLTWLFNVYIDVISHLVLRSVEIHMANSDI